MSVDLVNYPVCMHCRAVTHCHICHMLDAVHIYIHMYVYCIYVYIYIYINVYEYIYSHVQLVVMYSTIHSLP